MIPSTKRQLARLSWVVSILFEVEAIWRLMLRDPGWQISYIVPATMLWGAGVCLTKSAERCEIQAKERAQHSITVEVD
ncbi:MAG: hypothetical protein JO316_22110 [Abitibacteriaceae bacterium]|nr:hypothetical protein [Abditibacteriaceae bacterium]MBV9868059.1 hypothetical protein [Abditibacteriaceae bacterium]